MIANMINLTARQIQILRAIIEDFIETAQPVGSDTIDKKYQIGVSPATIRNEMVDLTTKGYLKKTHSSAGRVPTPMALKLYVNELMKERELSVADEVSTKEKVWKARDELSHLLAEATKVLADRTNSLGIAMTSDRRLFHSGYANLLKMPEFYDIDVMRTVLNMIEEASLLEEIFDFGKSENPIHIVYGEELGNKNLNPIGIIYTRLDFSGNICRLGVIGSSRFEYRYVIPLMKYFRGLLLEMGIV